jgi:hypothetical protein
MEEHSGGAKMQPLQPTPKKLDILKPGDKPKSDPVKLATEILGTPAKPFFNFRSQDSYRRRNPKYPEGFQPSSIRNLIKDKAYDTTSDTFPDKTVGQQLDELSQIENRELIEVGFGAADQCRSLGISNTGCFLCGFALKDDKFPHAKPTDFGYPQCEHLLPAGAAMFVYGLVTSSEEGKRNAGSYNKNYLYAHNICNQEKGSRLFLSIDPSTYSPTGSPILIDNIKKYLNDLYTYNSVFQSIIPNKDSWLTSQTEAIRLKYEPLSKELGRLGKIPVLLGVAEYFKNIDYLYAKANKLIKTKQQYTSQRVVPVEALLKLSTPKSAGKRKTFRRKNNGVSGKSKKQTYRATSHSRRKRRTSN